MEFFKCDVCGCVKPQGVSNTRECHYTNFNKSVHKDKGHLYVDIHSIQICDRCLDSFRGSVEAFCADCSEKECTSDCYYYDEWYGLQKGRGLPIDEPDLNVSYPEDTSKEDIKTASKVFIKWFCWMVAIVGTIILGVKVF